MPYSERNEPEKLRDGRYHRNKYHDGGTEQSRSYDEFIHAAPLLEYRKVRAAVIDVNDSRKPHDEKSHCLRNGNATALPLQENRDAAPNGRNLLGYRFLFFKMPLLRPIRRQPIQSVKAI